MLAARRRLDRRDFTLAGRLLLERREHREPSSSLLCTEEKDFTLSARININRREPSSLLGKEEKDLVLDGRLKLGRRDLEYLDALSEPLL